MLSLAQAHEKVLLLVDQVHDIPKTTNKGRVGLWLESQLGLAPTCSGIDCLDGEIKTFPVRKLKNGSIVPKETVAVTMMNSKDLKDVPFELSMCYKKLKNCMFVPYLRNGSTVTLFRPVIVHVDDTPCIKADYELLQSQYASLGRCPPSKVGTYLQTRTKGSGKSSKKTRAFYLKTLFLKEYVLATPGTGCAPEPQSRQP